MKKNDGIKIGNFEIAAIIVGVLGCVIFGLFSREYNVSLLAGDVFGCAWIAFLAAICGPAVGSFVGFAGAHILSYFSGNDEWLVVSVGIIFYGFWIGRYYKTYKIMDGKFGIKQLALFSVIQISASIIYYALFYPLFDFYTKKTNIYSLINTGFNTSIAVILGTHIVLIPIFLLISMLRKKK